MKSCYNCGSPISKDTCEGFPKVCEHWSPKKPISNADRIREMTVEDMAMYIFDAFRMLQSEDEFGIVLRTDLYNWLKQEVPYDEN